MPIPVNEPATIWTPNDNAEYTAGAANDVADHSGVELADAAGVLIVDSGVLEVPMPNTVWTSDDGS